VNGILSVGDNLPHHEATLWEARWQLTGGDWKMIDIDPFDPVTQERLTWMNDLRARVRPIAR
jgi:hypothetical protein